TFEEAPEVPLPLPEEQEALLEVQPASLEALEAAAQTQITPSVETEEIEIPSAEAAAEAVQTLLPEEQEIQPDDQTALPEEQEVQPDDQTAWPEEQEAQLEVQPASVEAAAQTQITPSVETEEVLLITFEETPEAQTLSPEVEQVQLSSPEEQEVQPDDQTAWPEEEEAQREVQPASVEAAAQTQITPSVETEEVQIALVEASETETVLAEEGEADTGRTAEVPVDGEHKEIPGVALEGIPGQGATLEAVETQSSPGYESPRHEDKGNPLEVILEKARFSLDQGNPLEEVFKKLDTSLNIPLDVALDVSLGIPSEDIPLETTPDEGLPQKADQIIEDYDFFGLANPAGAENSILSPRKESTGSAEIEERKSELQEDDQILAHEENETNSQTMQKDREDEGKKHELAAVPEPEPMPEPEPVPMAEPEPSLSPWDLYPAWGRVETDSLPGSQDIEDQDQPFSRVRLQDDATDIIALLRSRPRHGSSAETAPKSKENELMHRENGPIDKENEFMTKEHESKDKDDGWTGTNKWDFDQAMETLTVNDDEEEEGSRSKNSFAIKEKLMDVQEKNTPLTPEDVVLEVLKCRGDDVIDMCFLNKNEKFYSINESGRFRLAENKDPQNFYFYFTDQFKGKIQFSDNYCIDLERLCLIEDAYLKKERVYRCLLPMNAVASIHDGYYDYYLQLKKPDQDQQVPVPPKEERQEEGKHSVKKLIKSVIFHSFTVSFVALFHYFHF
ncbi:MAG: hypothetical protein AB1847_19935, partial [bacterium]